jgi:Mitochondrial carrier protein
MVFFFIHLAIDTAKTVLQIDSVEGFRSLMRRVKAGRIGLLYSGAIANAISAVLGHYPWVRCINISTTPLLESKCSYCSLHISLDQFYTYNVLSSSKVVQSLVPSQLVRNAGIGVVSSVVSDAFVNVFRVIKTTKQSLGSKQNASYMETIRIIVAADGYRGLFGRGLRTRIYANALQSVVFTIVWRGLADVWRRHTAPTNDETTST